MAHLKEIIRRLEEEYGINVYGSYRGQMEINGVLFLREHSYLREELVPNVLYVELGSRLGDELGRLTCVKESPLLLVGPVLPAGDPSVLFTTMELPLHHVFNVIQSELVSGQRMKLRQEELFNALRSGTGLESLVNVARTFLNNPITICDTSFCVIAASPVVQDSRNLEEKNGKLYLKDELYQDMRRRNIIKHIYTSSQPRLTTLQDYSYRWVFQGIRIHHAVVGYVCVRGTVRDFTREDLELIRVLSQMISVELQKDATYIRPTGQRYEYFLTELLEGHMNRTDYIIPQMVRLGKPQADYYTILLLRFFEPQRETLQFKTHYEQLLNLLPGSMVAYFRGDLAVLLPTRTPELFSEKLQDRFITFLKLNHMQAFASYPYTSIARSSVYYRQVKGLSQLIPKEEGDDSRMLVFYKDYFIEHMMRQCPDQDLREASVHPDVRAMIDYDSKNGTEYAHTIRVYLEANRNAALAANELHIHKSTFFYRIGKIADLFKIDLNDGRLLFAYEYSFRLMDSLK